MSAGIKFGRRYAIGIQGKTRFHELAYPLTCTFNVTRTQYASLNTASFSIHGLNTNARKDIYFDRNTLDVTNAPVIFRAGYVSQNPGADLGNFAALPVIFNGCVQSAFTERSGPEIVMRVEAVDGGFGAVHSPTSFPYTKGMTYAAAMYSVMKTMAPTVKPGQIVITKKSVKTPPAPFTDSGVFNGGSAMDVLLKYLPEGATLFIDSGVVNILGQNDTLSSPTATATLSATTGLLGIPKKFSYKVNCSTIFEPNIVVGQRIRLESVAAPWVNGTYKVYGFSHHGTISGTESGDAITDLDLVDENAK